MKLAKLLGILFLSGISIFSFSQKDETILKIGSHHFSSGEFWHIYNKNKHIPGFNETPDQFAGRYINYKLKVIEAITQGLDTLPEFISEYTNYSDELAASFLIDSAAIEKSAKEAFNHMNRIVSASHILIRFPQSPAPADTLKAWQRINELRERITKGEDFNQVAAMHSEDPSARQNLGKLGYFSAFQMVYPFEKAAFSTKVGDISPIVRTTFGYHLIKVHENLPNKGKIKVAHIMKMFSQIPTPGMDAAVKTSIDSIYNLLLNGADFAQMASQFSDDGQSAPNGGEMRPFALNEIVPEFSSAAFNLKENGEISEPIRTPFGWHIIKKLDQQPLDDYKTLRPNILAMMGNDERNLAGQKTFVENKRKTPAFKFNQPNWQIITNPLESGEITREDYLKSVPRSSQLLFSYYTTTVSQAEFIEFLEKHPDFSTNEGKLSIEKALDEMITATIIKTEKERLPSTNHQFRYLKNEYHDGLLIFELSNREIWSKTDTDSAALHQFYLNHLPEFSNHPTLVGTQCYVLDGKQITNLTKAIKKTPNAQLPDMVKKQFGNHENFNCIQGEFNFIYTSDNPVEASQLTESNPHFNSKGVVFWQGTLIPGEVIPYENCRGLVISSYQNHLEKEWVESLRKKHQPAFNKKVLKKTSGKAKK